MSIYANFAKFSIGLKKGDVVKVGIPNLSYDGHTLLGPLSLNLDGGPRVEILEIDYISTRVKYLDDFIPIVDGAPTMMKSLITRRGNTTLLHGNYYGYSRL